MITDEAMAFTRHDDGSVTVDRFVDQCLISEELLNAAEPELIRIDGDKFTITVRNGSATYEVVERVWPRMFRARRID